jgi:hypothetical protein
VVSLFDGQYIDDDFKQAQYLINGKRKGWD